MSLLPVLCLCAATPAVADDTPASTPAATPAQPTRIELEDESLTDAEISALFAQGYKPSTRNGQVVYCRRETPTGTRFANMNCRTADEIKQIARDSKELLAKKQMPSGNSPGH